MASITLNLPEDVKRLAESRAAAAGYSNTSEYVGALIVADAGEEISAELEAHLVKSLGTPAIEVSPEFWAMKKRGLC